MDDLTPTSKLGPWHDFTVEELAEFDDPWLPEPVFRPFDPDAFEAQCTLRDDGLLDANKLWGDLYRREWPGLEEARCWLSHALSGADTTALPILPNGHFHAEPTVAADTPLRELVRKLAGLRTWYSYHLSRLSRLVRPFDDFLVVLEAILEELGGHLALHWLVAMGQPPAAAREASLARVEAHIRSLEDPFDDMNAGHLYGDLAKLYPSPYTIRLAFECNAQSGYFWDAQDCWRQLEDAEDILACSDMMSGGKRLSPQPEDVRFWVARFGLDDLEGLFERVVRRNKSGYEPALFAEAFRVRDPGWLSLLYPLASRRKAAPLIDTYVRTEGINAVEGLLRLAGGRGKAVLWALDWLGTLATDPRQRAWIEERLEHHPAIAERVTERLGVEVARESVTPEWAKCTVPDWSWFEPSKLERPLLSDGSTLEAEAMLGCVANSVSVAGRITNLADVLWSLVEQWWFRAEGADEMTAFVAQHATESQVARLVEAVQSRQSWPRRKAGYPQRIQAMRVVSAIDHPLARRGLLQFTELYAEAMRVAAHELLEDLLALREQSMDEFMDSAVPTFGLDNRGGRVFDYGARQIRLTVQGRNDMSFVDQSSGRSYSRLPNARKADDARLVAEHRQTWKLLRKPLEELFAEEADRLEAAMVHQRAWTPRAFRALAAHPVLGHFARSVVWLVDETPCLLTPEGDLCDIDMEVVVLTDERRLRVAHPVQLDVGAWTEVLADHEIIQPFEQLARPLGAFDPFGSPEFDTELLIDSAIGVWDFLIRESVDIADLGLTVGEAPMILLLDPGLKTTKNGRRGRYQATKQKLVGVMYDPTPVHSAEASRLIELAGL